MTTVAWATDIHLDSIEDPRIVQAFIRDVRSSGARALLVGGDIAEAGDLLGRLDSLQRALERPLYYVLGNHDFYGSDVDAVRDRVAKASTQNLAWLGAVGPVALTESTALVGHDGWGDAQHGDFENAPFLNDYLAITDLRECVNREGLLAGFRQRQQLKNKLGDLGREAAAALAPQLERAARTYEKVLALTHVPPFVESCWHRGRLSEPTWLPGFTCKAMGDLLRTTAEQHPACRITVLCGHTHGSGHARIAPNLDVHTGEAVYGKLFFRLLDLEPDTVAALPSLPAGSGLD